MTATRVIVAAGVFAAALAAHAGEPASGAASRPAAPATARRIAFPKDPSVLDVKRDFAAAGDGRTDDTAALQKALDASCAPGVKASKVVYLPDGVYRVTKTLVVKGALGPWLYGETRDGTVIRLDDGAEGVTAVLRTHPKDVGDSSSDFFMRNIRNLTIDVGRNPEVDGIRYYATNSGIIQNVRVTGHGNVGVNCTFVANNGPNMVQDTLVEGFATGLKCAWVYGQVLSRLTIRNCREQGVYVTANAVSMEALVVENTPLAVLCDLPNNWGHWAGVVAVVGGRFTGGQGGAAIVNRGVLYARDIRTEGFATAIKSTSPAGDAAGPAVKEYLSHKVVRLFEDSPASALCLPIKPEPSVPWETEAAKWECVNDHGAVAGDRQDDTAAIQNAIDAAAKAGKTTVYLRGIGGPDPNWYTLRGTVRVHGSVRHVLGLGFGRVLGQDGGAIVVGDDAAPVVKFQNLDSFGGPGVALINRSRGRTMVVESCGAVIIGDGGGDVFVTDCPSRLHLRKPGQKAWVRQLNPEGNGGEEGLVSNHGGDLWVMWSKSEGPGGVRFRATGGGRTEILGGFHYEGGATRDAADPMFVIENSAVSIMGIREISHVGGLYPLKVRETRGEVTRTLGADRAPGWIGWALYSGRPGGK